MVIFALFCCLLDLRSGECNVVSLYVLCCPVNGSVCFVCCVFDGVVNCLMKQFAICLGVLVSLGALPWIVHCCVFLGPACSYNQQGLA